MTAQSNSKKYDYMNFMNEKHTGYNKCNLLTH